MIPHHQTDSTTITLSAPAKLTRSLRITGIRDDGMHLIDAEMVSLDLADRITIDPTGSGIDILSLDRGLPVTTGDDNSVARALKMVGRTALVRVEKRIPAGAGLGGGSADAAAILRWADFDDPVGAATLGADVAFCLRGGRARVTGIGEILEPLEHLDLTFTLLTPPFGCSTPLVYAKWDALGGPLGDNANDLEAAALSVEPRLARYRDQLGDATGKTPTLAGSGSTWFVEGAYPGEGRVVTTTVAQTNDSRLGALNQSD